MWGQVTAARVRHFLRLVIDMMTGKEDDMRELNSVWELVVQRV